MREEQAGGKSAQRKIIPKINTIFLLIFFALSVCLSHVRNGSQRVSAAPWPVIPMAPGTPQITPAPETTPTPTPTASPTSTPRPTPIPTSIPTPVPTSVPPGETRRAVAMLVVGADDVSEDVTSQLESNRARVLFQIAADGSFSASLLASTGSREVDGAVLRAARRWKWSAALQDGKPAASKVAVRVSIKD